LELAAVVAGARPDPRGTRMNATIAAIATSVVPAT
jgi:hypothetical protein